MAEWINKVTPQEFADMTPDEKEKLVYAILRLTKVDTAQMVAEFEADHGQSPNTLFVSYKTLARMPVKIKHIQLAEVRLTIIPMDAEEGYFKISLQDPWAWGDLFYT